MFAGYAGPGMEYSKTPRSRDIGQDRGSSTWGVELDLVVVAKDLVNSPLRRIETGYMDAP